MHIVNIQCYPYRLPLQSSFTTAHNVMQVREGAIVEVTTNGSISGIGEIAPLPAFAGGNLADALAALSTLAPSLHHMTLDEVLASLDASNTLPAATACGLEIAVLDALGQAHGCSVAKLLGTREPRHMLPVNAIIGAATTEAAILDAQKAVAAGFGCVKLKLGHETQDNIERVASVRKAIGPTIHLRLDANAAWTFEQARTILSACAQCDIQYVEQPLPADDLVSMCKLRQSVSVPIAIDEALCNLESAQRILAQQAAAILIVKPQLAGGLRVAQQIIQMATAHDVPCVITSTIETGIGLTAALHLAAASPEVTLECGLATLHLLEDDLLLEHLPIHAGSLIVPTAPGLGVHLNRAALAKYSHI